MGQIFGPNFPKWFVLRDILAVQEVPYLPKNKPTYLMGVGTPANILEAVDRGEQAINVTVVEE